MTLVEYLYVDKERLDSYFEQISPPEYYGERAYSVHEKITKLTEDLEDTRELAHGRPNRPWFYLPQEKRKRIG